MTTIEQTPFIDIDVIKTNIDNYKLFISLDQIQYEIELKEWLKESIYNATKNGSTQIQFKSRYELSQEFIDSVQPLKIKFDGSIYVESPISVGKKILIGYSYYCDIKDLIFS
jgi:hypothetical protein